MQQTHSYRHLFASVIIYIYMPVLSSILFSYLMNYTATLKTQDSKLSFWHLFWYEDCRAGIAKSDERPTVVRQSCLWTSSRLIRWLNLQNSFFSVKKTSCLLPWSNVSSARVCVRCHVSIQQVSFLFFSSYKPSHLKALPQITLIQ